MSVSPEDEDYDLDVMLAWAPYTGQPMVDYQIALGSFLLTFNRIENSISDMIGLVLTEYGRPEKIKTLVKRQLMARVEILELLIAHRHDLPELPTDRIKKLSDDRASLAHGHFQQTMDGTYKIHGKGEIYDWNPTSIEKLTEEAREIHQLVIPLKLQLLIEQMPENENGAGAMLDSAVPGVPAREGD